MKKNLYAKQLFAFTIALLLLATASNSHAQTFLEISSDGWGGTISWAKPAIADIDGDGLPDMLVGDENGRLHHLEQQTAGDTSFYRKSNFFNGIDVGENAAPTFTDLDGDGLLDLIIGTYDPGLYHYEQVMQFSEEFELVSDNFNGIAAYTYSFTPTIKDIDGDGLLDLIIGYREGYLKHWEQSAINSTVFTEITETFNGIGVGANSTPTFTDLDGDGLLDMFIGNNYGVMALYEQSEAGTYNFELAAGTFAGIDVDNNAAPLFYDLDGDSYLDMLVGNQTGDIYRYEQSETAITDQFNLVDNSFNNIDVGARSAPCFSDLENDGLWDILIGNEDGTLSHYVQAFAGADLFYQLSAQFNAIDIGTVAAPTITDLDNNGLLDLIIGKENGKVSHYEQSAANPLEFLLITENFIGIDFGDCSAPTFIDLDGNGLLDLIVGRSSGNLYHYEQSVANSLEFSLISYSFANGVFVDRSTPSFTDVDNNGLLDLIIGGFYGTLVHYQQVYADTTNFELVSNNFSNIDVGYYAKPEFNDYNNDGILDLFIGSNEGTLKHYKQASLAHSFNFLTSSLCNVFGFEQQSKPCLYDIDNDGLMDLLVGYSENYSGSIAHFEQTAINSIEYTLITETFNNLVGEYSAPTITDIDADGLLDLFVGNNNGTLNYYEQNSENSYEFSLKIESFSGIDVGDRSAPCFTDLDSDGLFDLLIGESNGTIKHYEQIQQNPMVFTVVSSYFNNIDVGYYSVPFVCDLSNDGLFDLLIGEYGGNINHYQQASAGSLVFSLITENYGGINTSGYSAPAIVDMNGNGSLDLISGAQNGGLNLYLDYGTTCANLLTPENEAVEIPLSPTLSWSSALNAEGYFVNLGTNYPPTNILNMHAAGSDTSYTPAAPLAYNQTYYWQIVPYNVVDTAVGCEIFAFATQTLIEIPAVETFTNCVFPTGWSQDSIVNKPPVWTIANTSNAGGEACEMTAFPLIATGTSRLITPMINTSGLTELGIEFDHFFDDAGSYGLVLFLESSSDGISWTSEPWNIISGTGNVGPAKVVVSVTHNLGNKTWLAFNISGNHNLFTSWSIDNIGIFDATLPPLCTTPILPEDAATDVRLLTNLSWNPTANTIGYKLYFGTDNPPSNIINGTNLGDLTSYTPSEGLQEGTNYYWKAVPYNANGDATTCEVWSFETKTLYPPQNLTATLNSPNVELAWDEPEFVSKEVQEISYNVYRNGGLLNSSPVEVTVYVDENVPVGMNVYTVKAIYEDGLSAPAGPVEVVVPYSIPTIYADPLSFTYDTNVGEIIDDLLTLTNLGEGSLTYSIEVEYPATIGWLTINLQSGSLNLQEQLEHTISIVVPTIAGTYTANINIASNDPVNPVISIPIELNVIVPLTANFGADFTVGQIPLTVQFSDSTIGTTLPTTWEWDFQNDGIVDSYEQNPIWIYENLGFYNVKISVSNGDENSEMIKENYIEVNVGAYTGPVWHVSSIGDDVFGNGSEDYPFATIQHGIDVSSNGDTVLVAPGTYYEHINFSGKNILLSSHFININDPSFIEQTSIDGSGFGDIVTFNNYESSDAKLIGFTVTNGFRGIVILSANPTLSHLIISNNNSNQSGGGIWARNSGAIICYNKISDNSALTAYTGGGLFIELSDLAIIHNNEISNNSTSGTGSGGGIYVLSCSPLIYNNEILNNITSSGGAGGGVYCNGSNSIIHHNLIAGNESSYGAGIQCNSGSSPTLLNNTIINNLGDYGGGMRCRNNSSPILINNIIWGNTATSSGAQINLGDATSNPDIYYCDIEGGITNFGLSNGAFFAGDYENCIDSDPLFNDPGIGDFTLSNGSPCIDTGDPTQPEDLDLSVSDMGYRYFHLDFVAAFDADNTNGFPPFEVNFSDFSTGNPTGWAWDFDDDGIIDSSDPSPSWIYNEFGKFTVTLTTSNASDEYTRTKTDYINVDFQFETILTSIQDVPDDQGGWVMVNFARSVYDTDSLQDWGEMYNIEMNSGHGWFNTGMVGAYGSDYYSAQVHTSFDSSQYSNGLIDFRIIAIMQEGNYASAVGQGYSVDNLAPAVPNNMNYELLANEITINWNPCPDFDFAYFAVYKSDVSGYFPETPMSTTTQPAFTDQLTPDEVAYYVITAIDFHGNESNYSNEIETLPAIRWELKEGWSGISSFIEPSDANIENMFDKIESQLIILQNENGFYWPGQNINTLGNWNMESGYQIKVSEDVNLSVSGNRIENHIVQMQAQWNLIPILSECAADVAVLFDGTALTIVKEVAGTGIYWPEFGINTLQVLEPGKTYFVLMSGAGEVTFPECDMKSVVSGDKKVSQGVDLFGSSPWQLSKPSAITHTIAIPAEVVSGDLSGTVIGAFDVAGNCYGAAIWNSQNTSITLFGDDPTTSAKDGFVNNEPIAFMLWNSETHEDMMLDVTFTTGLPNPEMFFAENGLSAIAQLKLSATGITDSCRDWNIQIIPNPAKDEFVLKLDTEEIAEGRLTIYKLDGSITSMETITENKTRVEIDQLKAGVYLLKIEIEGNSFIRRLIKH